MDLDCSDLAVKSGLQSALRNTLCLFKKKKEEEEAKKSGTQIKHQRTREITLTYNPFDGKKENTVTAHKHRDLEASTWHVPAVPTCWKKFFGAFYAIAGNFDSFISLISVSPCQVVLVVDFIVMETAGGRDGRWWEIRVLTDPQLLRNLAPVASATCRDTPESPVLSDDRCLWLKPPRNWAELMKSVTSVLNFKQLGLYIEWGVCKATGSTG